jgi:hypothetical protein
MKFTVDTKITGMLFTRPKEVRPLFQKEFHAAMLESTLLLQKETVDRTPISQGFLRRSIGSAVRGAGLNMTGIVGSPLVYALPVEQGAAPHFPPLGPVELWAKSKSLSFIRSGVEITLRNVAFLIARKISITGLGANWMFRDALEASTSRIVGFLNSAQKRILVALGS